MSAWHEFYDVVASLAATLLGLLFVSVSLNAEVILGSRNKHSKRLAEQAFSNYLGALVISLIVLIPNISDRDFGVSLLFLCLSGGLWVLVRTFQSATELSWEFSHFTSLRRFIAPAAAFGILGYAGFEMVWGHGEVRGSIAAGVMVLLISATVGAWDLLIRIGEEKYAPGDD
jgi:hypothetical protein